MNAGENPHILEKNSKLFRKFQNHDKNDNSNAEKMPVFLNSVFPKIFKNRLKKPDFKKNKKIRQTPEDFTENRDGSH